MHFVGPQFWEWQGHIWFGKQITTQLAAYNSLVKGGSVDNWIEEKRGQDLIAEHVHTLRRHSLKQQVQANSVLQSTIEPLLHKAITIKSKRYS